MSKQLWKGSTLLAPIPPALVSCGSLDAPNALTVAWTGIVCSQPPKTYISLRPERYSYGLIKQSGEFAVNLPTAAMARAVDYCGVRSGRNENKFETQGLTPAAAEGFSCPVVAEAPLSLLCRVTDVVPLGSHDMFLADIAAVLVDDALLDAAGRLDLARAGLLAYAHGEYFALGKKLGTFGFSVKKKKRAAKRAR
ncbi:MAG TPA: flavin reductase family protein [Candidatus Ruthenibacterium merdigallinarum]|nr:flavin reductase family protein [Candidatus Ruthenibacterium merdigallinarum]